MDIKELKKLAENMQTFVKGEKLDLCNGFLAILADRERLREALSRIRNQRSKPCQTQKCKCTFDIAEIALADSDELEGIK